MLLLFSLEISILDNLVIFNIKVHKVIIILKL